MDLKNLCIICGLKSKKLENRMCTVCKHLADEKFYEIESDLLARKYFKDYLHKAPDSLEMGELKKLFKGKPKPEWVHGIMPSKCPFCFNMSTNRGIISSLKVGSEKYVEIVENGKVPTLVCKACGDLSLYTNHVYNFSKEQSVEILKHVAEIKKKINAEELICCSGCAKGLGPKKEYEKSEFLTEENRKIMNRGARKTLCEDCINRLKDEIKTRNQVQADK